MDIGMRKLGVERAPMIATTGVVAAAALRRRAEGVASMRKEEREAPQVIRKRCKNTNVADNATSLQPMHCVENSLSTPFSTRPNANFVSQEETAKVAEYIAIVRNTGTQPCQLLQALTALRKELSTRTSPPIQEVIDNGGIAPLVARLNETSSVVQFEAAWALTNIASGTTAQTAVVIEAGAVEAFFRLLLSPVIAERPDLCDQCLWALGNIVGDGDAALRDRLLGMGVVGTLGQVYEQIPNFHWDLQGRVQVLRTLTWLMSGLCRGCPAPPLEEVDCAFDYFAQVLVGTDDTQMLSEALWGLCYLLEGAKGELHPTPASLPKETFQMYEGGDAGGLVRAKRLLSAGFGPGEVPQPPTPHPVVTKIVRCTCQVGDRRSTLQIPALQLLGGLVSLSTPEFTDVAIAAGALKAFRDILVNSNALMQLRCDAAWALSNVAAGTFAQTQCLVEEASVWDALCDTLEKNTTQKVRRECAWAITNVAKRGLQTFARLDGKKLIHLVTCALKHELDPALQRALLDAGEAVFRYGDEQTAAKGLAENPFVISAGGSGFIEVLEDLQHAEQEGIYRKALHIMESWFLNEDRENAPPQELPAKNSRVMMPSAICGGSPIRPAAYKFGA